jgi:hypothetical protein
VNSARYGLIVAALLAPGLSEARDSDGRALRGIDLLSLVRLPEDSLRGPSTREGGALNITPNSLVRILYQPSEEYDLRVVAERRELQGKLVVGLVSGDRQFDVVIDNFNENEHRSGLHNLDGKHVVDRENDVIKGPVFKNGTPHRIVYCVRKGRVSVSVDGKEVIRWEGDFARLSIDRRFNVHEPRAMFVGNAISTYRITKINLAPLAAGGGPLRR